MTIADNSTIQQPTVAAPQRSSTSARPMFFTYLYDTQLTSEPLAGSLLRFLISLGGKAMLAELRNLAGSLAREDDELSQRRYSFRVDIAVSALLIKGAVFLEDVEYGDYCTVRVGNFGLLLSKRLKDSPSLENIMQHLDAARGYTGQTTFLHGLDIITPINEHQSEVLNNVLDSALSSATTQTIQPKRKTKPKAVTSPRIIDLLGEAFDPNSIIDERERILREVTQRRGQDTFRADLLTVFGSRCAITGCDAEYALEAAHIIGYKGKKTNHPANGLLLRADLHTLFDLGLLAIDTKSMTVLIAPKLKGTQYQEMAGRSLTLPSAPYQICVEALDMHRAWAQRTWDK